MVLLPDVTTLSLCSTLSSAAFMVVYLTLWRMRTGQGFLLDWAASSGIYVAGLIGFALLGNAPVVMAVLHALLGLSGVLVLTGMYRFDGVTPFRAWMLLPVLGPGLFYLAPALLIGPAAGQAGGIVGIACDTLLFGAILIRRRGAEPMGGRHIAGWAYLGYLPGYLVTLGLLGSYGAMSKLAALIPLLSDQVLLPVMNLALIALPGERAQASLRLVAQRDTLTGALNRAGLMAHGPALVAPGTAVVAIDIDHFKAINDRHGHAVGDAVLVALATCAMRHVSGRDLVVRLGGDEFVLVLAAPLREGIMPTEVAAPREAAMTLATNLRRALQAIPDLPAWTVSMGVSTLAPGETDLLEVIARADRALYEAKASGRDRAAA